jgi:hypothetical protein
MFQSSFKMKIRATERNIKVFTSKVNHRFLSVVASFLLGGKLPQISVLPSFKPTTRVAGNVFRHFQMY